VSHFCATCHATIADGLRVCPACGALQAAPAAAVFGPGLTIERGYGRIVVDARIGEGGMGFVWRGWLFYPPAAGAAAAAPVPIAIKVLKPQAALREEVRRFFVTEAEALQRISHPNIVRFHELFEWPPAPPGAGQSREAAGHPTSLALAMEYVDGDTLEDVIARHIARSQLRGPGGSLPGMAFRRAWYYFQQLLGALAAIHALGIVHRDVKPSNVLIRRDGIVKLTDFGIARVDRPGGPDPRDKDLAPGTGAYMSPEQVLSRPLDGRSDLYSAAIVLYEMLAGRTPILTQNKSEFVVRQEQVTVMPPPIRTFVAQAPLVLDALFARALAKDPAYRFTDAIQMGSAFREALGIPETEEWRAQAEIAKVAVAPTAPGEAAAQQKKLGTLRDFLVQRYKTMSMTAQ
jgi:serine/threonine-protein kinase